MKSFELKQNVDIRERKKANHSKNRAVTGYIFVFPCAFSIYPAFNMAGCVPVTNGRFEKNFIHNSKYVLTIGGKWY